MTGPGPAPSFNPEIMAMLARGPGLFAGLSHIGRRITIDGNTLDSRAQTISALAGSNVPSDDPLEARVQLANALAPFRGGPTPIYASQDRTIAGPGGDVPIRIYQPGAGGAPRPVLLWFHGGGFALGSVDSHDEPCRRMARAADAVVISVDYRLAPEDKFPAGLDDCRAAFAWAANNAAEIGGDAARLAVGGDSAGGNFAAALALACRDDGGPQPGFQLLVYPVVDAAMTQKSYELFAEGFFLTRERMAWFFDKYLASPEQAADPLVSPLRAEDLSGLPPAHIITAGFDPLRDEGRAYAARLEEAGVAVELAEYPTMIHAFFSMAGVFGEAAVATERAARSLRAAFADKRQTAA
ncbi:MAG TPA: alpha/beta hydrolase [Alphaproteobacteria bacterium]|jgi:acetyl esterase|nr:alpha/beta hydrolase [Alphaproteobacteria bacterium]MDP6271663.1 alpha/beta hydrolase [Alphaproteobacteria bacterium]HJM51305.1 alpha/beta hydrolase [Alphaproteobacteria bacterium]